MRGVYQRRASWVMVIALLASLLFIGHWSLSIPLPFTPARVDLIRAEESGGQHDQSDVHEGAHGHHCHGGAATCSDVPLANGAGFALLRDFGTHLGTKDLALRAAVVVTAMVALNALSPERRPPRAPTSLRPLFS